jgi:cytochrome c oxidase subunit 2
MPIWGQLSFQEGTSAIIELINYFHDYMMIILVIIITFVTYLFVAIMATPKVDKYTIDSHILETVWTVVPMVILLFMAFPSLYLLYLMEDISNPSVTVKVIGHQWYWEYQYSNSWCNFTFDSYIVHDKSNLPLFYGLDVDNRLVLPTFSTVLLLITSADVIHSWTVPTLGIKTDAIPGRLNYLNTLVPLSGVYYGQCREICGSNHSFMPIVVEFVPVKHFVSHVETLLS